MNLRLRFVLIHTLLVSAVLVISFFIIYIIYNNSRKEDLNKRLWAQAIISYQEANKSYQFTNSERSLIDNNEPGTLPGLRVIIIDSAGFLTYSNGKELFGRMSNTVPNDALGFDAPDVDVINNIKQNTRYFFHKDNDACVGIYKNGGFVIIKSNDKHALERMAVLRLIMLLSGLGAVIATCAFSLFYVYKTTKPLVDLSLQMRKISETNLKERFHVNEGDIKKNEIMQISANFNGMLERLEKAFDMQKSFTHHASHELRTPLASMLAQTETALRKNLTLEEAKEVLSSLKEDQQELIELTNSLLLLSQYEKINYSSDWPMVRIDELLYDTISMVKRMFPNISVSLEFLQMPDNEISLSISGNYTLLRSAFRNLIKNAFQYSEDRIVCIAIKTDDKTIDIYFDNKGKTLSVQDKDRLFIPFFRGENAIRKRGFGLGLSIVKRIVQLHNGNIAYEIVQEKTNRFTVSFDKM